MRNAISLIISALSLVIAIIALIVSWRTQKRQIQIQEARETDRITLKKKANLRVHIGRETLNRGMGSFEQYFLYIENKGLCDARNIELLVDGKRITEHGSFLKSTQEITHVGPESKCRYVLKMPIDTPVPSKAEITWEDDSGQPDKYSTTLTL